MFTEELDRLREQLRDSQERRQELERQRDQLVGEVRLAKQETLEANQRAAEAVEQAKNLGRDLSDARRVSERVPLLEQTLETERARLKTLGDVHANTQAEVAALGAENKRLREESGNVNSELGNLRREVGQSQALAEAAKQVAAGLKVMLG